MIKTYTKNYNNVYYYTVYYLNGKGIKFVQLLFKSPIKQIILLFIDDA